MASPWNLTSDFNSPEIMNQLPEDLKAKLMLIDCELLYGKDDWWMSEVLFTPSEYHLDFLQWILTHFNESLEKYFQQPQSNLDRPHEVQAQRILEVCSNLGLCNPKDEDLIKGKAPYNKLLRFWQHLLSIFLIKTHKNNSDIESPKKANSFSKNNSYDEHYLVDNRILNTVCERDFYNNRAFKVNSDIIPIDIYRQINLQNEVPNGELLRSSLANLERDCQWQRMEINEIQKKTPYDIFAQRDLVAKNMTEKNINLVLSDLEKMAVQFTRCHEDLKPWLKSEKQVFSTLGQKFQEACDKLEEFTNALNQLSTLNQSYGNLENIERSLNNDKVVIKDYLGCSCDLLTS